MQGVFYRIGILAGWLVMVCAEARGSVIVYSTVNSTSPIAFSEKGSFVDAGNFSASPAVNDVRGTNVFTPRNLVGAPVSQAFPGANGITATIASTVGTLAAADIRSGPPFTDGIYLTEIYTPSQQPATLTISGLNAASTYLIQFPHGESRNIPYHGLQVFTDSSGNTASLLDFGQPLFDPYALITLKVSGSTSVQYFMPGSTAPGFRGPSFNGYTVRLVPIPAALPGGLALVGAVGFFRVWRRRGEAV